MPSFWKKGRKAKRCEPCVPNRFVTDVMLDNGERVSESHSRRGQWPPLDRGRGSFYMRLLEVVPLRRIAAFFAVGTHFGAVGLISGTLE